MLAPHPRAQLVERRTQVQDPADRRLDLRSPTPRRREQRSAIRLLGGRLGVDPHRGDALSAAQSTQRGDEPVANPRVVELADRAARDVRQPPADERHLAQQELRAGQRLLAGRPDQQADRRPAAHRAQLTPLPQLWERVVRGAVDEGVPCVPIGLAPGVQLAGHASAAYPASRSARRAASRSSQGRFVSP